MHSLTVPSLIRRRLFWRGCACLLVAAAMPGTVCRAATILYEPFDYPVGGLNGQNGGVGFSEAWTSTGTPNTAITSPGLTYSNLQTSGNAVAGTNSMFMKRRFDSTGLTGDGASYWFSILFAATDTTTGTATAIPSFFSNFNAGNGQSAGFAVSYNIQSATTLSMDARIGGSIRGSTTIPGTNYYDGSVAMVLGRITFSDTAGQDRLEVWLNPTLGVPPGTPLFNVTGTWVDPGSNNAFYMNKYDPPDRLIDEIRLGTSIADVTPVPEPAVGVAALVAAGFGAVIGCRRRRGLRR
jgi:hypothetical protein